jgi:nicotinamidase-related amidase
MPVTKLDVKSALIIIDLQKGIVALPTIHPADGVVAQARALAMAFRRRGLPVVLVNVAGLAPGRTEQKLSAAAFPPDWAELVPELEAEAGDYRISKRSWGAFATTNLETLLRERDVTQVVLAGIATSIGVESTAREAYGLGLNVTIATDAVTDRDAGAHANSLTRIFPRLGETGTSADILALLEADSR